jgi:hypothetical protein
MQHLDSAQPLMYMCGIIELLGEQNG